jgi:hypothetical protein
MNLLKTLTLTILLFITSILLAQSFEGVIEFKNKSYYDETNYIYYISSDKVRIDELDKEGKVSGTMLVDLKTKQVLALNHSRKLYMEIKSKASVKNLENSKIFKTSESKKVLGLDCTKWTVDNPDYKSKATYWVINDPNYFFFQQLLAALNRKDKVALYFMQIPENAGYFPILGEEKGYDGKLKAGLETKKLTRKKVAPSLFEIPTGYVEFKS